MTTEYQDKKESRYAKLITDRFKEVNSILSLGCGEGFDEIHFAKCGIKTYATDTNTTKLSSLGLFATEHKIYQLFIENLNILEKFKFEDDFFDSLYFKFGLHFFNDNQITNLIIPEIKRVTKPNGLIFIIYRLIESDKIFNSNYSIVNKDDSNLVLFDSAKNENAYRNIINKNKYYQLFSKDFDIDLFEITTENIYNKLSNDNNSLVCFSIMRNKK